MAFKFNSAGRKLYNKMRVSDGALLARNVLYANAIDDATIIGDDGTIKFLAIDEEAQPVANTDYDPHFFFIDGSEGPEDGWQTAAHPSYFIRRTIAKRPTPEIQANAENEELLIRNMIASPSQTTADLYILVAALAASQQNLNLTEEQQAILDQATKIAKVLSDNRAKLKEKKDAILLGQEPDLKAGYTLSVDV